MKRLMEDTQMAQVRMKQEANEEREEEIRLQK